LSLNAAQSLFWIAVGALFVPMISRRIRVPTAVGELVYGMLIGPHLLGLIAGDAFIDFMAQLGFAILMFGAGMEIDFAPIRKRGSKLLGTALIWTAVAIAAATGAAMIFGIDRWLMLAVCSVSIGLASVILKERDLLGEPLGQAILASGLIGESVSILILTVFYIYSSLGFSPEFFRSLTHFAGIFLLAYLLMRFFRFIIWWTPKKIAPFLESEDPMELGVRLAVALLFIFLAAATFLGVEAILGAFIAGALFGFIFQEREVVADKINAIGHGFFIPFFFIVVGSHFEIGHSFHLLSSDLFYKLLLISIGVKLIPSLLYYRVNLNLREITASGFLLAAPLTLTVAVAEIGGSLGEIDGETQGMLILVAVINGLLCPFLARFFISDKKNEAKIR